MTFIFPLLLGGLALAGIPVLLHLIMRQKPKHLLFPAFRFLLQRHRTNQRKIRLRHLLLLALRLALIAGLCLALARPKIFSERLNLSSDRPVAAVLVFDTSYSMGYVSGGRSLLDEAKRRAQELLDGFPPDSKVAILDTAEPGGDWLPSISLARDRIPDLRLRAANAPITSRLGEAYRLLKDFSQDAEHDESMPRFLCIFSDRTQASWDSGRAKDLEQLRDRLSVPANAVFVDVGAEHPVDLALVSVELPHQIVPTDGQAIIRVTVRATGEDCDTEVICRIDGEEAPERKPIQLAAGQSQVVSFQRGDLRAGTHQVELTLASTDALTFNNACFATFEVRGGRKTLILVDDPRDADFWRWALQSFNAFRSDVRTPGDLRDLSPTDLSTYQAICLLSVAKPDVELWEKLRQYVRDGGGLAVVPGAGLEKDAYNKSQAAQQLLPGRLVNIIPDVTEAGVGLSEVSYQHPMMAPFRKWRQTQNVDFEKSPPAAWRYWEVKPSQGESSTLMTYSDKENRPALLERVFDPKEKVRGRVLLFTTAFDRSRLDTALGKIKPGEEWNNFAKTSYYVVLVNTALGYLAGDAEEATFNYFSGQPVTIALPVKPRFSTYNLEGPGVSAAESVVSRTGSESELLLPQATTPGNFLLFGADHARVASFSINQPAEESDLTRVPAEQIESLLGAGALLPVGQTVNLHDALQGRWNQPVELFPWLMIFVLLALAVENLLANKFYRREGVEPASNPASVASSEESSEAVVNS